MHGISRAPKLAARPSHEPASKGVIARRPATAEGLKAALRQGDCATASPTTGELQVLLVKMQARGKACGFVSCDAVAESSVSITVLDSTGQTLSEQRVSTSGTKGCGMSF